MLKMFAFCPDILAVTRQKSKVNTKLSVLFTNGAINKAINRKRQGFSLLEPNQEEGGAL